MLVPSAQAVAVLPQERIHFPIPGQRPCRREQIANCTCREKCNALIAWQFLAAARATIGLFFVAEIQATHCRKHFITPPQPLPPSESSAVCAPQPLGSHHRDWCHPSHHAAMASDRPLRCGCGRPAAKAMLPRSRPYMDGPLCLHHASAPLDLRCPAATLSAPSFSMVSKRTGCALM